MGRVEKTVFISYRRTNIPWALAIYQNLTAHGYDVFFDYDSIASGDFEQVILGNIRARAHFLVVLTPSALERCVSPDDWLRREIETALDEKRNIVPVFLEGFDFGSPSISKYLTGKLATLKKYNGQNVPAGFFDDAMEKIREKFLNIPLDSVLHPVSATVQKEVKKQQVSANGETQVKEKELTVQEWVERGNKFDDAKKYDDAIHCFTEAIRLKPDYAIAYGNRGYAIIESKGDLELALKDLNQSIKLNSNSTAAAVVYNNRGRVYTKQGKTDKAIAEYNWSIQNDQTYHYPYNNRGLARKAKGDLDGAIKDCTQAIRLKPDYADAYYNRGIARYDKGDLDGAIKDYTEAIRLKPDYAEAYNNRGNARFSKGDFNDAIKDYIEAIRLKPDDAFYYNNRGNACYKKGEIDGAIKDYTEAIRLKSDYAEAYCVRGNAYRDKGSLDDAIKDCTNAIHLKPGYADAYHNRANAHLDKGDLDWAIKDYTEVIRLDPNFMNSYWGRGNSWFNKEDYYSAAADYQKYFDLGGTDERVRKMLNDVKKKIK
jgi:tetratricopeptide (TPR) repeat protein